MIAASIIVLCVWTFEILSAKASNNVFNQCIRSSPQPSFMRCIGQQTISSLQSIDKVDNYTLVSGLEFVRPLDGQQRTFSDFFVNDPTDFRGMLENAGTIVGQRSIQWDLTNLHPGLCLRIGPTSDSNSMLEFIIDPALDRGDRYLSEEPSTARILTRQFIVPFLLGLKFNLVTLLPLLCAAIILILKKAVFLGKCALFLMGILGFGGLFSFGQFGQFNGVNHHHHHHRPFGSHGFHGGGFGGGLGGGGLGGGGLGSNGGFGSFGQNDPVSGGYYKNVGQNNHEFAYAEDDPLYLDTFYNYDKKFLQNKVDKLFDKEPKSPEVSTTTEQSTSVRTNSQRSFAWKTID